MLNVTYSLRQVVAFLAVIVREVGLNYNPNGGADNCIYAESGTMFPSGVCIVGRLIDKLGFLGLFANHAHLGYTNIVHVERGTCSVLWPTFEEHGIKFSDEAQRFLRAAQRHQDKGHDWGSALYVALDNVRRRSPETYSDLIADTELGLPALLDGHKATVEVTL